MHEQCHLRLQAHRSDQMRLCRGATEGRDERSVGGGGAGLRGAKVNTSRRQQVGLDVCSE